MDPASRVEHLFWAGFGWEGNDPRSRSSCGTSQETQLCRYLFVDHKVAHALCGGLSELIMVLKHVILDLRYGVLLDNLLPETRGGNGKMRPS